LFKAIPEVVIKKLSLAMFSSPDLRIFLQDPDLPFLWDRPSMLTDCSKIVIADPDLKTQSSLISYVFCRIIDFGIWDQKIDNFSTFSPGLVLLF
jgi:hypothetical protein